MYCLMFVWFRDTIKGNNLTQCYIDATAGCNIQGDEAPTWTMQRWERVMQDIYKLCDGGEWSGEGVSGERGGGLRGTEVRVSGERGGGLRGTRTEVSG